MDSSTILPLVEEIPRPSSWDVNKTHVNNGIFAISGFLPLFTGFFYIPSGAGFLESTVVCMNVVVVVSSGCWLWRHQEWEDLPCLAGKQSLLSKYTYDQPNPFQQPSQHPPISFSFIMHNMFVICLACQQFCVSRCFFGICGKQPTTKINTKSGKKKQTKIHPKNPKQAKVPLGQVQVAFFQYKHQLQLRCHEAFHCLQHGRTAVYRGTHGPGHRSAIPADGKQSGFMNGPHLVN